MGKWGSLVDNKIMTDFDNKQGSRGHGKSWKSHGILFSISRPGKVMEICKNDKSHGKVMEFCEDNLFYFLELEHSHFQHRKPAIYARQFSLMQAF